MSKNTLKKTPVKGMNDILPAEKLLRDYVTEVIRDTYRAYGFTPIETPAMEDIRNLSSNQGGENEKLIFKVLKRGRKLNLDTAKSGDDLVDFGMRYDLTLPLSRFYAANSEKLPKPFKALQTGSVWRAERPQRGRLRQFTQCDIDIIGEPSNLAEIELILAASETIGKLGFRDFDIRINDRRILMAMAACAGFPEDRYEEVFVCSDKLDKIGADGVKEELDSLGMEGGDTSKYLSFFEQGGEDFEACVDALSEALGGKLDAGIADNIKAIARAVNSSKAAEFSLVFDPSLVRGMGYYTGPIFEISIPEFGGSCGGGGRYDNMIGRFSGNTIPACGFSIGFERIILLLKESGFTVPGGREKTAFLIDKRVPESRIPEIMMEAQKLRAEGGQVLVSRMNKNKKFQKTTLEEEGYTDFKEFYE